MRKCFDPKQLTSTMLLKRRKKADFIQQLLNGELHATISNREEGLDFLIDFFNQIRPNGTRARQDPEANLGLLIQQVEQHAVIRTKLQRAFLFQLINTDLSSALTESGIPLAGGFWQELGDRVKHKILPPRQDPNDFLYVLNRIFYKKSDFTWVESISRQAWVSFFQNFRFSIGNRDRKLHEHLLASMRILTFQVAQTGLQKEVSKFLPDISSSYNNPFVEQSYIVHGLQHTVMSQGSMEQIREHCHKLKSMLFNCEREIEQVRQAQAERGTSLRQTYSLLILSNRIQRMQVLTDVIDMDNQFDIGRFVDLFRILVRNENRKNSIREFMSQGVGYLAYQIAEHKGAKGSKYITSTWKEYRQMITSAMWGGLIISFIAVIKNLLGRLALAPFWQGFVYSINYSLGFVLIEQTKSTLATKQPAFTASAVAGTLDTRKTPGEPNLHNLAVTVAKVSRSQFASFFGNLIIVFPASFLLAWGFDMLMGYPIAAGGSNKSAAAKLLIDQHPWHSFSLLYACNTGFFLFLSGIMAGYVQNKIRYGKIGERLVAHPVLRVTMARTRRQRLADLIENNAGAFVGNVALGFFLGMAGILGNIFGIPFDIRHITIAAGNTAIGVYGIGFQNLDLGYLAVVFAGVIAIGLLNFLVSFALAFFVAVKSRGIHLKDYPQFIGILWRYFKKYPLDFIRPRKRMSESS